MAAKGLMNQDFLARANYHSPLPPFKKPFRAALPALPTPIVNIHYF